MIAPLVLVLASTVPQSEAPVLDRPDLGLRWELPDGWSWEETAGTSGPELILGSSELAGVGRLAILVFPKSMTTDAIAMRASSIAVVERDPDTYERLELFEADLAGRTMPALTVERSAEPRTWVRQLYAIHGDHALLFQTALAPDAVDEWMPQLEEVWTKLELLEAEEDEGDAALRALAARCDELIDWAPTWEEAAERARATKRAVLVYARIYPGFSIADDNLAGLFMEPEVRRLIATRYVPLRLTKGMEVPFEDPALYGLSDSTFGTSMMIVRPGGEVVLESGTELGRVMLDALPLVPDLTGEPTTAERGVELARELFDRGETARAVRALGEPRDAAAHLLLAEVARRERDGEAALAHLDRAARAPGADELAAERERLHALVLAHLGRDREALAILSGFRYRHPDHPLAGEVEYLLGTLQLRHDGIGTTRATWQRLIDQRPDDPAAWRAAGAMTGTSFGYGLWADLTWRSEAQRAANRRVEPEPLSSDQRPTASDSAIAYLLGAQDRNGSWVHASESGRSSETVPDEIKVATTVICAQALVPHASRPEVRAAVERALEWTANEHARIRALDFDAPYMDYSPWSRGFALAFLAECAASGIGDRALLDGLARGMAEDLAATQRTNGGWSYYLTGDPESGAAPEQSISFTTAAVVLGLERARSAGLDLPEELFDPLVDGGLDALEASRRSDGSFLYMLWAHDPAVGRDYAIAGAAGRGPACELALLRGGRSTPADVERALEIFREHKHHFAAEIGKVLMHSGPDGQGSHYPMFDYATAAMAAATLEGTARRKYAAIVYEELMQARAEHGAYRDNPILGWSPGTGLGLLALNALAR